MNTLVFSLATHLRRVNFPNEHQAMKIDSIPEAEWEAIDTLLLDPVGDRSHLACDGLIRDSIVIEK